VQAVTALYDQGLVVEASGAVGYAALSLDLIPDIEGRTVVVIVSGGNITADEMADSFNQQRQTTKMSLSA
jgi:threonine dehydratase